MKLAKFRLALMSGVALSALAVAYPDSAGAQMYSAGPGFYLSLEGRYLMNEGGKSPNYDTDEYGTGLLSPIVKARADDGWGGKAMLGYRFGNNWDVGLALSGGWLKGRKSDLATTLTATSSGIGIGTELEVKLDYYVADFEAGYNWQMGQSSVRVYGGVRFADFSQRASGATTVFTFTGGGGTSATGFGPSKRKTTYWGIGPRIGINGQFALGGGGFHLFGGLAGALLFGKHKEKADARFIGTFGTSTFSSTRKSKSKMVPNAEGELGLGYQFGAGTGTAVALQAGYRAEGFWGAGTKSPSFTAAGVTGPRTDYIFHGPFVRLTATFGAATPVAAAPPPAPAPAPVPKKNFLVFFDFDRSNITADAQRVITEAAAAAKAGNVSRIQLTGHTDRSGSDQYNMALSLRRGEAVKQALIRQGIPAASIAVIGRGESQPLVPTADGVREPQNRRVEILL
ncbi:MAG: Lpg1974 family pore-forming outer membrane protein [Reyranellaceae bacterium]